MCEPPKYVHEAVITSDLRLGLPFFWILMALIPDLEQMSATLRCNTRGSINIRLA
jgi:hypothetical protein